MRYVLKLPNLNVEHWVSNNDADMVFVSPADFIRAVFASTTQVYDDFSTSPRGRTACADILKMFCAEVFLTDDENPSSVWLDDETGTYYFCGYTYSEGDFYHTARSYAQKVKM